MSRKNFLKPSDKILKLNELNKITGRLESTSQMPLLFVGHGNPINAITENEFTKGWQKIGKSLPKPNAILCISAHWETDGTFVTAMEKPRTIHDFYGFPKELYEAKYPAAGSPELAEETRETVKKTPVGLDQNWGLDHGCWAVLKHMFPKADVPIVEMSLDRYKNTLWHYELAGELSALRKKGVLIVGSGNIVHNLGMMDWHIEEGFGWAAQANEKIKKLVAENEHRQLIKYESLGKEMQLAVPTPEHYLPLLYVMGLKEKNESTSFFNDKTVLGSVSMTSIKVGK